MRKLVIGGIIGLAAALLVLFVVTFPISLFVMISAVNGVCVGLC